MDALRSHLQGSKHQLNLENPLNSNVSRLLICAILGRKFVKRTFECFCLQTPPPPLQCHSAMNMIKFILRLNRFKRSPVFNLFKLPFYWYTRLTLAQVLDTKIPTLLNGTVHNKPMYSTHRSQLKKLCVVWTVKFENQFSVIWI